MGEDKVIEFYLVHEAYGEFSNFSRFRVWLAGKSWPTSEHYFQAMKFDSSADREAIRLAATPKIAAEMGRDRKRKLREDWEAVKEDVMRDVLLAKFTQHEELRVLLLSTGDCKLVEHTKNDAYWGDGGDGTGKNRLGGLLMEVRGRIASGAFPVHAKA